MFKFATFLGFISKLWASNSNGLAPDYFRDETPAKTQEIRSQSEKSNFSQNLNLRFLTKKFSSIFQSYCFKTLALRN